MESRPVFPEATKENAKERADLVPGTIDAWRNFSRTVFKEGALSEKTKQLIAVAVSHVTQCPYCIRSHTHQAKRKGATNQEIMEAVWIAAEMRAGAGYTHSIIAMDEMEAMDQNEENK